MTKQKKANKRKVYLKGSSNYKSPGLWQVSDLTDSVENGVEIETSLSDQDLMNFLDKLAQTSSSVKRESAIKKIFGEEKKAKIAAVLNEKTVGMSLVVVDQKSSQTSVMTRDITDPEWGEAVEAINITPRKEGKNTIWKKDDEALESDQLVFSEAYNERVNQPLPFETRDNPINKRTVYIKGLKSYKSPALWQVSDLADSVENGVEIETSLSDRGLMDFLNKIIQKSPNQRNKAIENAFGNKKIEAINKLLKDMPQAMSLVVVDEEAKQTSVFNRDMYNEDMSAAQESINITPRKEGKNTIWKKDDEALESHQLVFSEAYNKLVNQPLPPVPAMSAKSSQGTTLPSETRHNPIYSDLTPLIDRVNTILKKHVKSDTALAELLNNDALKREIMPLIIEGADSGNLKEEEIAKRFVFAMHIIADPKTVGANLPHHSKLYKAMLMIANDPQASVVYKNYDALAKNTGDAVGEQLMREINNFVIRPHLAVDNPMYAEAQNAIAEQGLYHLTFNEEMRRKVQQLRDDIEGKKLYEIFQDQELVLRHIDDIKTRVVVYDGDYNPGALRDSEEKEARNRFVYTILALKNSKEDIDEKQKLKDAYDLISCEASIDIASKYKEMQKAYGIESERLNYYKGQVLAALKPAPEEPGPKKGQSQEVDPARPVVYQDRDDLENSLQSIWGDLSGGNEFQNPEASDYEEIPEDYLEGVKKESVQGQNSPELPPRPIQEEPDRAYMIGVDLEALKSGLKPDSADFKKEFVSRLCANPRLIRNISLEVEKALSKKDGYSEMSSQDRQDEVSKRVEAAILTILDQGLDQELDEEVKKQKIKKVMEVLSSPDLPEWAQNLDPNDDLYKRWSQDLADIKAKVSELYTKKPQNIGSPELPPRSNSLSRKRSSGLARKEQEKKIIRQKSSIKELKKDKEKLQNLVQDMIEYAKNHNVSIEEANLRSAVLAAIRSIDHAFTFEYLRGEKKISRQKSKDFDGFNRAFDDAQEVLGPEYDFVEGIDTNFAAKVNPFVKKWKSRTPKLDPEAQEIKDMFKKEAGQAWRNNDLVDKMMAYAWKNARGTDKTKYKQVQSRFRAAFFSKEHQIEYLKGEKVAEDKLKRQKADKLDEIDDAYNSAKDRFKITLVEEKERKEEQKALEMQRIVKEKQEQRGFEASPEGIIKREFCGTGEADRIAQIQNGEQIDVLVKYVKDKLPEGVEDPRKEITNRILAFAQNGDLGLLTAKEKPTTVTEGLTAKASKMMVKIDNAISESGIYEELGIVNNITPEEVSKKLAHYVEGLIEQVQASLEGVEDPEKVIKDRILAYFQEEDLDFLDGKKDTSEVKIKTKEFTPEIQEKIKILDRKLNSKFGYMEMQTPAKGLPAQASSDRVVIDSDTESERSNSEGSRTSSVSSNNSVKSNEFPKEVAEEAAKLGWQVGNTTDGPTERARTGSLSEKGSQKQNPSRPRSRAQSYDASNSRDPSRGGIRTRAQTYDGPK